MRCCGGASELRVKVERAARLFDVMGPSVEVDDIEGMTVLGIDPPVLTRSSRALKRAMDVVGAGDCSSRSLR